MSNVNAEEKAVPLDKLPKVVTDAVKKMFPKARESDCLTWSKYRKDSFANIKASQNSDGSWTGSQVGPGFATPVYLTILQLDTATLPIYQR